MERARKSSGQVPDGEQNVDRLSAVPDGVICHILSFLPTKLSVSTSILAKRWRFLWAHVPVLDFVFDYANPKRASFPGIINTVMLRHKVQRLTTFRLIYTGAGNDGPRLGCYEHESCIATVVERNVQNLCLALRVELPRCLLTCKTLVDLAIGRGVSIPPTAPIYLPNLKKLDLWNLDFTRLLSGCPVIEELIIIRGTTCKGCSISSPTLKRLTIIRLLDIDKLEYPDYMVTIYTPALRYLKVHDDSCKHISISPCTSLVEADIFIDSLGKPDDFNRQRVLKFLDNIRNVKCLSYRGKIWDGPMPVSFVKFENLTKLELCAPWSLLTKFLESADHLQVLAIFEDNVHSEHWMSECLLHSLRTVRIYNFRCREQGFNMVRYILRNAPVLERMEIYCFCVGLDLKEKFDAIRNISLYHRESKKCELNFS